MGATLLTHVSERTPLSIESNGRRVSSGVILVGAQYVAIAKKCRRADGSWPGWQIISGGRAHVGLRTSWLWRRWTKLGFLRWRSRVRRWALLSAARMPPESRGALFGIIYCESQAIAPM